MEDNHDMPKMCHHHHRKMFAWMAVLFGLTFLLGDMNILTASAVSMIWPILVIIVGVKMMCKCHCKDHEEHK